MRIDFDGALEVFFVQGRLFGRRNRRYVAVVIPNPLEGRSENHTTITETDESDIFGDARNLQYPSNVDSPSKRRRLHLSTSRTISESHPAGKEKTAHQAYGSEASEPPRVLGESRAVKEIDPNTLRQHPQVLITSLLKPDTVGTIVELYDVDVLHVKTGGIAMVLIRYRVEKLVGGAENQENQDVGREQRPSPC